MPSVQYLMYHSPYHIPEDPELPLKVLPLSEHLPLLAQSEMLLFSSKSLLSALLSVMLQKILKMNLYLLSPALFPTPVPQQPHAAPHFLPRLDEGSPVRLTQVTHIAEII